MVKFGVPIKLLIMLLISMCPERTYSHSNARKIRDLYGIDESNISNEPLSSHGYGEESILNNGDNADCVGPDCSCSSYLYCSELYGELISKGSSCKHKLKCPTNTDTDDSYKHDLKPLVVPYSITRQITDPSDKVPLPGTASNVIRISNTDVIKGVVSAKEAIRKQDEFEKKLKRSGIAITENDSAEFSHFKFFSASSEAERIAQTAFIQEQTAASLKDGLHLTSEQVRTSISQGTINTKIECPSPPVCNSKDLKYRRYDGSCNNLRFPLWGKSMTAFERMTPALYSDGISEPRKSQAGTELPSARKISTIIATDLDKPSANYTLGVMQFGQYLDHDITQGPISRLDDNSGIQCCKSDNSGPLPKEQSHMECFPILVPANDPFYSEFGRRCLNFVRSLPAPNSNCSVIGPRNQMNSRSHFIDGSAQYGTSEDDANKLRELSGGLLKTSEGDMLMEVESTSGFDFVAGDTRVNTHPHLSATHTIYTRQHNKLARKLSEINPTWTDEDIFQVARKILVAQIQHICYNEWLPIVIGDKMMEEFGLFPLKKGFSFHYTATLNPNIRSEFTAAAFRFGHSTVQGDLELPTDDLMGYHSKKLEDCFNQPMMLKPGDSFGGFMRGLYMQAIQNVDFWVVDDLTNKLFKPPSQPSGLDLVSLNIQRGRDNGLGTWNQARKTCGLERVDSFKNLINFLDERTIKQFQTVYKNVEDIDLFIAGISEKPGFEGGIVGETFNCIIREQFFRLKFGDRFFYENGGGEWSFTEAQLDEIRKSTWARLICDNDPTIKRIQSQAFIFRSPKNKSRVSASGWIIMKSLEQGLATISTRANLVTPTTFTDKNPLVHCSDTTAIPTLDLTKWRGNP